MSTSRMTEEPAGHRAPRAVLAAADNRPAPRLRDGLEGLATIAHELRTPVTTIAGVAGLLRLRRHELSTSDMDAMFAALERQTTRLCALLDDLLEAGRTGHATVDQREAVDLVDVIADALEAAPAPPGVTVTVDGSPPALPVLANRASLARVIVNLLSNAYHHGGPNIVVEDRVGDQGKGVVELRDDGPGVPAGLVSTMFEPFIRGGDGGDGRSRPAGNGLGLALSREIVESFGGRIDYQGLEPHGARFIVTLPSAPPPSEPVPARNPERSSA
jgi:two-component system OmpR family sensor kinase